MGIEHYKSTFKEMVVGSIPTERTIIKTPVYCGFLLLSARASKLLCLRVGIEQRSHIFLPKKIDELMTRQNFLTKKF